MSKVMFLKERLANLPPPMGQAMAHLPFGWRPGIGRDYRAIAAQRAHVEAMDVEARKAFVFRQVKAIAIHAVREVPFYRTLYGDHGVDPQSLGDYAELERLPVVTKAMLQSVPLAERTSDVPHQIKVNTGGTSGQPLSFTILPGSVAHEWAHMLEAWERVGFSPSEPKMMFSGQFSIGEPIAYDSLRHSWILNLALGWNAIADAIMASRGARRCRFLHGYPSAIFAFVDWLETNGHPLLGVMADNVDGMMLGSEYPVPAKRAAVEALLGCKSVSWYGHRERAVLAREVQEKEVYVPYQSYGWTEAVARDGGYSLVSTSYPNRAAPFIRYDTGDGIDPVVTDGLLQSFRIKEGRGGDRLVDRGGNLIPLSGILFGRFHPLYERVSHIQVMDEGGGKARIFYTTGEPLSPDEAKVLFLPGDEAIDYRFERRETPFRTPAGKVPLLVSPTLFENSRVES